MRWQPLQNQNLKWITGAALAALAKRVNCVLCSKLKIVHNNWFIYPESPYIPRPLGRDIEQ